MGAGRHELKVQMSTLRINRIDLQLKYPLERNVIFSNRIERGWLKVTALPQRKDEETFAINPVQPEEVSESNVACKMKAKTRQVRDLDFADHAYLALQAFVTRVKCGESVASRLTATNDTLRQCIFFLSGQRNAFLDPLKLPLPSATKSVKAKQKLFREQNVLQAVSF